MKLLRPAAQTLRRSSRARRRRNGGDITIWHRGGGHKRKLRDIDFKRDKNGVPRTVVRSIHPTPRALR